MISDYLLCGTPNALISTWRMPAKVKRLLGLLCLLLLMTRSDAATPSMGTAGPSDWRWERLF